MKNEFHRLPLALLIIALCLAAGWAVFLFTPTVQQSPGVVYQLKVGTSKKTFVKELYQQGIIKHPTWFSMYIYLYPKRHLKAGEYLFAKGASPYRIWRQVTKGVGLFYHPFTIVPGWTFQQIRNELQHVRALRPTITALSNEQVMAKLGSATKSPEGLFYPDTYFYTAGVSDMVILKMAYERMAQQLTVAWKLRSINLPFTNSYQALIAASLVEKEAYLDRERPLIAGVLINRLNQNMLLQFDPTIIYGLGANYQGKIYKEDLVKDTPYNTYLHKGLPPTPIAMPSMASILAVMHPEPGNYFYFVAKGDGSHQFSHTLAEHNAFIERHTNKVPEAGTINEPLVTKYVQGARL
jgi:UPF0755 protein